MTMIKGGNMKFVILLLVLLLATPVLADVVGEVVSVDKDDKNNIRVWTQYKIDGVEVASEYPKIQGKSVYATRYAAHNFAGMTDEQIEKVILYQMEIHSENLVKKEFTEKTISTNDEIFDKHLNTLVGKSVTKDEVNIKIDNDTTIKVKTDGTSQAVISVTP